MMGEMSSQFPHNFKINSPPPPFISAKNGHKQNLSAEKLLPYLANKKAVWNKHQYSFLFTIRNHDSATYKEHYYYLQKIG